MLTDIFQAYFDCRRRKRRTPEALLWEQNFEENCIQLNQEITAGSYQPDDYQLIYVTDPVMREIFVPTFRDRVVHHLLANWLRPQLEKIFLYDNYAGREGRGTLFGIRRAEKFMRQVTQNYQKPAYVLKLDIASYFRSIPKKRLWEKIVEIQDLSRSPKCSELNSEFYEGGIGMTETQGGGGAIIDLLKKIIFHDPRIHFSGIINAEFPKQKSLFSASPERGLPLGDLVSQLLGNFYLHTLDHFVKHTLCIKYYGRYMDDMIFFNSDRDVLDLTVTRIRDFLQNKLGLELHEGKIILGTCEQGIPFLGAYIKPWRTYIGNRTKKNMYACIASKDEEKFEAQMQSYLGLMGHFETFRLKKAILQSISQTNT